MQTAAQPLNAALYPGFSQFACDLARESDPGLGTGNSSAMAPSSR